MIVSDPRHSPGRRISIPIGSGGGWCGRCRGVHFVPSRPDVAAGFAMAIF